MVPFRAESERLTLSPPEMTEEEMIDLALRLSEQEASIVAIRRQKEEEEAMMKAIQESVSHSPPPWVNVDDFCCVTLRSEV